MPNGLSSAPRCFTKLLKPVYSILRQYGYLNIGYIDDSYLQGSDTKECLLNISDTQTLFTDLGFVINVDKSCVIPAQQINFLGFVLDSVSMTITLTDDKKAEVKSICNAIIATQKSFYNYRACPVSGHACLLPTLSTIWPASLQEKNLALRKHKGNTVAEVTLSSSKKDELSWWIGNVDKAFNPISHGNPVLELRTDTSKKGWGVYLDGDTTQGLWSVSEGQLHINELELKAVHFAVQAFGDRLKNKHVKILCDNSTTVAYINAMGAQNPHVVTKLHMMYGIGV